MTKHTTTIAKRWFKNSFCVIVILLLILDISLFGFVNSYYYRAAEVYISSELSVISSVLSRLHNSSTGNLAEEIRSTVEQFDKKNQMELMAIDTYGDVTLSSSGFKPLDNFKMPDYDIALKSENQTGKYIGFSDDNEKYMAVTTIIEKPPAPYTAVRMVVSLRKIDLQIIGIMITASIVSALVLLLVLALGLYFIRSIVTPLRSINVSARSLASGDFSVRIEAKNDDEMGELCKVFNYMANELQNAEKTKNEFISSVSHELRTPLTAIKGWSETIMEMKDEQTLAKGMKVISTETERLSEMVEELLDFSRMQNGQLNLQKANMDILAELSDAALIYEERAKQDKININYTEPSDVVIIYGDKNRIRQVFINIIDNAIKYSKQGSTVTIETTLLEKSIEISVKDSGCGISAEDLPKIKTRFYKANNTVRGSGIGLAVADQIIMLHGGTLLIESEAEHGTTVKITLPTITL